MKRFLIFAAAVLAGSGAASGEDDPIADAMRAAPPAISGDAAVLLRSGEVLREGTNGWYCFPDNPNTDYIDSMCGNAVWRDFFLDLAADREPSVTSVGLAYMLATEGAVGPHLMLLVPGLGVYGDIPEGPSADHPWVLWKDTPRAHLIIPVKLGTQ